MDPDRTKHPGGTHGTCPPRGPAQRPELTPARMRLQRRGNASANGNADENACCGPDAPLLQPPEWVALLFTPDYLTS